MNAVTNRDLEPDPPDKPLLLDYPTVLECLRHAPRTLMREALAWTVPHFREKAAKSRRRSALHEAGHVAVAHLCMPYNLEAVRVSRFRHDTHELLSTLFRAAPGFSTAMSSLSRFQCRIEDADRATVYTFAGLAAESREEPNIANFLKRYLKHLTPGRFGKWADLDDPLWTLHQDYSTYADPLHINRAYLQLFLETQSVFQHPTMAEYIEPVREYLLQGFAKKTNFRTALNEWLYTKNVKPETQATLRDALMEIDVEDCIRKTAKPE